MITDSSPKVRDSHGAYFTPSHYDCLHVAYTLYLLKIQDSTPRKNSHYVTIIPVVETIRDLMLAGF